MGLFPEKNDAFHVYLRNAVPHLTAQQVRLRISAADVNKLAALYNEWKDIFPKSQDPGKRTTGITKRKNALWKKLEKHLRKLYKDMPQSVLTTNDRVKLNLRLRSLKYKRVQRMDHAPSIFLGRMSHLQRDLLLRNPATPDTRAMPYKHQVFLEMYIGKAGMKEKDIPFDETKIISRYLTRLLFESKHEGKTVYLRGSYVNSRGERGPASKVVSFVVV